MSRPTENMAKEINVLIVDDCSVTRSIIKRVLELGDFVVGRLHEAGDGLEGLQMLMDHPVDLLLMDINMPLMDGMEMLDKLKTRPEYKSLSVLVVSSESNPPRIGKLKEMGVHYLHKPFAPESLRDSIRQLI